VDEVVREVLTPRSRDAFAENRRLHELMTRGTRSVVYTDQLGADQNPTVKLIDFRDPDNNDYLAANQVTVIDGEHRRRFDVVCYLNGLPVGIVELKKGRRRACRPAGRPPAARRLRRRATAGVPRQRGLRRVRRDHPPVTAPPSPRTSTSHRGTWATPASPCRNRRLATTSWR
jgi:hypothetical protein